MGQVFRVRRVTAGSARRIDLIRGRMPSSKNGAACGVAIGLEVRGEIGLA